jgi:hypothetical protein
LNPFYRYKKPELWHGPCSLFVFTVMRHSFCTLLVTCCCCDNSRGLPLLDFRGKATYWTQHSLESLIQRLTLHILLSSVLLLSRLRLHKLSIFSFKSRSSVFFFCFFFGVGWDWVH